MARYETLKDATYGWVESFDAFPQGMLEDVNKANDYCEFHEVTPLSVGDRVFVYDNYHNGDCGEITKRCEDGQLEIELDDGGLTYKDESELEIEYRDGFWPMWGTLWQFHDSVDNWWLEGEYLEDGEPNPLEVMADCGFRIYESEEYGYFFGIDGCGYDFFDSHWIPLYKARGLHWHEREE